MKNKLMNCRILPLAITVLAATYLSGQASFVNGTSTIFRQGVKNGVATAVVDVDGDLRDDLVFADEGGLLTVLAYRGDGSLFDSYYTAADDGVGTWSIVVGDVDQNGSADIIQADGNKVLLHSQVSPGAFEVVDLYSVDWLPQSANLADYDADGDLDYFLCNDDGLNLLLENQGSGTFVVSEEIDFATVPVSDNSGNYSSIWTDIDNDGDRDLYIAKCRSGVTDPADPRRINALYINEGNGQWTEQAAAYGIADGAQTWSVDAGDVDNDGDQDLFVTNHDAPHRLFINEGASFEEYQYLDEPYETFAFQGVFYDMDNNGWLDIVVTDGTSNTVLYNDAMTFTQVEFQPFVLKARSAIVGDINNDGFGDIWAQYNGSFTGGTDNAKPDDIYLNMGNQNNYIKLALIDAERSTAEAAVVTITGPWGSMTREVKIGTSYGQTMSDQLHFGLGEYTVVDDIAIRWADGTVQQLSTPLAANRTYHIRKSGCVTQLEKIELPNEGHLCEGSTLTLTSAQGQSVLWSSGDNGTSTVVSATGTVHYSYIDADGCQVQSEYAVVRADSLQYAGARVSAAYSYGCIQEPPVLSALEGLAYSWSTGEEEQLVVAQNTGVYSVTITSFCGEEYVSESLEINLLDVPVPVVENDSINPGETAVLRASSEAARWYDSHTSDVLVLTGSELVLDQVDETVSYYVEQDSQTYYTTAAVGEQLPTEDKYSANSLSGGLIFRVVEPIVLNTVTVETDLPGVRRVVIQTAGEDIWAQDYDLTIGIQQLTLDAELPAGIYFLQTDNLVNLENFGHQGPRLVRTQGDEVQYPYFLEDVSIVTGTNGFSRYFYFYDWQVSTDFVACTSERAEVVAYVRPLSTEEQTATVASTLYPNPAQTDLYIAAAEQLAHVEIVNLTGQVVMSQAVSGTAATVRTALLAEGLYLVTIRYASGQKELHKMLKRK